MVRQIWQWPDASPSRSRSPKKLESSASALAVCHPLPRLEETIGYKHCGQPRTSDPQLHSWQLDQENVRCNLSTVPFEAALTSFKDFLDAVAQKESQVSLILECADKMDHIDEACASSCRGLAYMIKSDTIEDGLATFVRSKGNLLEVWLNNTHHINAFLQEFPTAANSLVTWASSRQTGSEERYPCRDTARRSAQAELPLATPSSAGQAEVPPPTAKCEVPAAAQAVGNIGPVPASPPHYSLAQPITSHNPPHDTAEPFASTLCGAPCQICLHLARRCCSQELGHRALLGHFCNTCLEVGDAPPPPPPVAWASSGGVTIQLVGQRAPVPLLLTTPATYRSSSSPSSSSSSLFYYYYYYYYYYFTTTTTTTTTTAIMSTTPQQATTTSYPNLTLKYKLPLPAGQAKHCCQSVVGERSK